MNHIKNKYAYYLKWWDQMTVEEKKSDVGCMVRRNIEIYSELVKEDKIQSIVDYLKKVV